MYKLTSAFSENHRTLSEHITSSEIHYAVCSVSIPASSPTLLVIVLYGLADGVVDHKPHVRLVNAHTKRYSSYNHLSIQHHIVLQKKRGNGQRRAILYAYTMAGKHICSHLPDKTNTVQIKLGHNHQGSPHIGQLW